MAMTTCAECSSEISDLAQACPHCGAPVTTNAGKEQNRLLAIDILAKRNHRRQGLLLTVVVFLLAVWGLENVFENYPGDASFIVFAGSVFAAYFARLTFFAFMAKKISERMSLEEFRRAWLTLGGLD